MDWKLFFTVLGQWFQQRLQERSTYLGVVSLASSLGVTLAPEYAQAICAVSAAIVGALLVATKDPTVKVQIVEVPKD